MTDKPKQKIIWLRYLLLTLILGLFICGGLLVYIGLSGLDSISIEQNRTAELTIIPYCTLTPTSIPLDTKQQITVRYVSPEGFSIGAFVQIMNTQGAGLKIRSNPGTGDEVLFIGMDGDLFKIIDGPDEKDGFVWWKLAGFSDKKLEGWAAANYLTLAAPPVE